MVFICIKCNKSFKFNVELNRHLKRKIPCDRIIECTVCTAQFKTLQLLKRHTNRKKKCLPPNIVEENILLKRKIELMEASKQTIINNTLINNNNNNIINIFDSNGKIFHQHFLKSNPIEQLTMDNISLDSLVIEDYTDELSNIYNFTNMIKEVCFNMEIPSNWIICKDDLFNKLKLKIDRNNILDCIDNILYLIYTISKQVVNFPQLNDELLRFYNKFIIKYENDGYKDNEHVKQFIKGCNDELFKHFSTILNIISERKNIKIIEPIKINNFGEEDITFFKRNTLDMEFNGIIERKYHSDIYHTKFKINNFSYNGIIDIKMIDIFIYFLKNIYKNVEQLENETIKYDNNKFYIYKNENWTEIEIKELLPQLFSKIHLIIKMYKIKLDDENMHTEDYNIELYKKKI